MGSILASDIPGSSLTIAFLNYERDSATRKFLVESTGRADAITTVISSGLSGSALHPDNNALKADGITAQAVGKGRWIVTVQYARKNYGSIPSIITTLANIRMAYEGIEVYCSPSEFSNGLPFGGNGREFVHPGGSFNADPKDPPKPWIYNRPVANIQLPFSTATFPSNLIEDVGALNTGNFSIAGFNASPQTVRFDGMESKSVGPNYDFYIPAGATITYYGTESYTYSPNGFYKQIIEWDDADEQWYARNVAWG